MILSPAWMQGMLLTLVIGYAVPGYLALRVYEEHAPVPARVADAAGKEICTGDEIVRGREAFLTYGLMQFGSVSGHGAYLGLILSPTTSTASYLQHQPGRFLLKHSRHGG